MPARRAITAAAAEARSILSCPAELDLAVDGLSAPLPGEDTQLTARDDGRPTFTCRPGHGLADAAEAGRRAVLTVSSGLPAAPGRPRATLVLTGRLAALGALGCACCGEARRKVELRPSLVVLVAPGERSDERIRIPLNEFGSPAHLLNRGHLRRTVDHLNLCHQDQLRNAVAALAQRRLGDVAGVELADLRPDGVEIAWVADDGAHRSAVRFPRVAADAADLGALLRQYLHTGNC